MPLRNGRFYRQGIITLSRHIQNQKIMCDVCRIPCQKSEIYSGEHIRAAFLPIILKRAPDWTPDKNICLKCLNLIRSEFVAESLIAEKGELNAAEVEVLEALRTQELIVTRPDFTDTNLSFGARVSDRMVAVGGSWLFVISFCCVLVGWIVFNTLQLRQQPFDPYPYILLNLVLSCLAALQAPIIMMSQNRQAAKDRLQVDADYKTNLKAELEIRHIQIKLDQLISQQWQKLLEIQQVQIDLLQESVKDKSH